MTRCSTVLFFSLMAFSSAAITRAEEAVINGTVKSIVQDKKEFMLTDSKGAELAIKLGDNVVINRGGKDGQGELKAQDKVCVYYDKGALVLTANYILVQEGDSQNWTLAHGDLKKYDAEKSEVTYTDRDGKDSTYSVAGAKIFVNREESKIESLKVGEHLLAILKTAGGQSTLKSLVVHRS